MIAGDSLSRHRAFITPSMSSPSLTTSHRSPSPAPSLRHSPSASPSLPRRTSPHSFSHNPRAALALAPAAAFLLDLGGSPVLAVLAVGLIAAYILDSLRFNPAAPFFAVWLSLLAALLTFFASASLSSLPSLPLAALALLLSSQTTLLIALWASLNFQWIQIDHAPVAPALERLLFACLPVAAPALFAWASVSAFGIQHAAYYHMAFACAAYWLYALPRPSSFASNPADAQILGPIEGCLHSFHLLFAPALFFIGSHHAVILSSSLLICDFLLLFFIPLLFLMYTSTKGALCWLTTDVYQMRRIRVVYGAVALVVTVICLEIRLVIHSYGKYLHASPAVSMVLVTVAMLGGASAVGAYAAGIVQDSVSSSAFTLLTMVSSTAGAVVLGFPKVFIPAPLISGFYLARFFTKKSLSSYFAFVILTSSMVLWFIVHNFWSLNIWLAGMPVKSFCNLIFASAVVALLIPGLALFPTRLCFLTELGLIGHTLLLCCIENRFFSYAAIYYYGFEDDVMYPSYMVLSTTFLGLALVRRLAVDKRIRPVAVWFLTCLYSSKIAMLFITSKSVLWISAVLLLAISPPLFLYEDKLKKGVSKMKAWHGYAHACVVAFSAWLCSETIFEVLQWWGGRPPSDGLLLGFGILLTGIACLPIVALHFPHVQSAKRFLVMVVATGLLFVLMQPPIPQSLAFKSDIMKAAHQTSNDISIYGFVASKPSWPSWLLIATILLTLAAASSIIPVKYIVELRIFFAVAVGITFGIYVCAEYFFQAILLSPFLVATTVCASVFLIFTHIPSASSTWILPRLFGAMVTLFPVTYLMEGLLSAMSTEGSEDTDRFINMLVVDRTRMSLLGLYAMLFMLIALEIKFELASIVREKALKGGPPPTPSNRSASFPPKLRLIQQRRASTAPSFAIKRLAEEAAWMPWVGNISTVLCFVICLILNMHFTGGSNRAIFFLAPILLLLNQDSDIFAGFGDRQRYFPVIVAISGYLVFTALYRIWEEAWHSNFGWGIEIGSPDWFLAVKNVALLILTLPNHVFFNRFLWDCVKQRGITLLLAMPLNLSSIILTDIISVRVLGLLGIIYSLAQYLVSQQMRIAGLKYI